MKTLHITTETFEQLKTQHKPILLDFYAAWCAPCRALSPTIDEIAQEHPEYIVGKVNVDEEPALARMFRVLSIPTLIVLEDGKNKGRLVGAQPKEKILAMLQG